GAVPNTPVQNRVPNDAGSNSHCSDTMALVPSGPMEISGSLLPLSRSSGVSVKLGAAVASTEAACSAPAKTIVERVPANERGDIRMIDPLGGSSSARSELQKSSLAPNAKARNRRHGHERWLRNSPQGVRFEARASQLPRWHPIT